MGIGFRDIPLSRAAQRFPMLNLDTVTRVVETDGAGMLFPSRIVLDLVVFLTGKGVIFHANHLVSEIDAEHARPSRPTARPMRATASWSPPAPGPTGWCRACALTRRRPARR